MHTQGHNPYMICLDYNTRIKLFSGYLERDIWIGCFSHSFSQPAIPQPKHSQPKIIHIPVFPPVTPSTSNRLFNYPTYPAYLFQHLHELAIFRYCDILKEGRLHTLFKKGLDEIPAKCDTVLDNPRYVVNGPATLITSTAIWSNYNP